MHTHNTHTHTHTHIGVSAAGGKLPIEESSKAKLPFEKFDVVFRVKLEKVGV